MEPKTFVIQHDKSDGVLNVDDAKIWCTVGEDTIFAIRRNDIRYCSMADKNTLVLNREVDGTMRLLRIHSKHAGAILSALS